TIDKRLIRKVRRRKHAGKEVGVVDEEQASSSANHPGRKGRLRSALTDHEKAEQNHRCPRRRPQVGEDQEVLVEEMEVPYNDRHGGDERPQDTGAEGGLPSLQT